MPVSRPTAAALQDEIQANVFSQQTRLSLKLDNVSVQQLFVEIERMTNLAFVYNTKDVESVGMLDVDFTNEEIGAILDACLKDKGLEYSIVNDHVVVRRAAVQAQQVEPRLLTGKVLDKETGDPLPGATVTIKGTTIGAAADVDAHNRRSGHSGREHGLLALYSLQEDVALEQAETKNHQAWIRCQCLWRPTTPPAP